VQAEKQDEEGLSQYVQEDLPLINYGDFGLRGKKVLPEVVPFTNMVFKINSSEPVECRVGQLSIGTFESMPDRQTGFTNSTLIFTKAIPTTAVMKELRAALGLSSPLAVFMFDTYKKELDNRKADLLRRSSIRGGSNRQDLQEPFADAEETLENAIAPALGFLRQIFNKMFIGFARSEVTNFIICKDRFENQQKILLKYKMQRDILPPELIHAEPASGSVLQSPAQIKLFLNEPADCRYARQDIVFENMENHFSCMQSVADSVELYECEEQVLLEDGPNRFFVRCRDQPLIQKVFYLNLTKGTTFENRGEEVFGLFLEKEPTVFNLTYRTQDFTFDIRRDCTIHPRQRHLAYTAFTENITNCARLGNKFSCSEEINITHQALDYCDFVSVNRTFAPVFEKSIYATQDALQFDFSLIEVDVPQILFDFKLKADYNCKLTEGEQIEYEEIPESKSLYCFQAIDRRHTCRSYIPVTGEHQYKIVCQEDTVQEQNINIVSTDCMQLK